MRSPESQEEKIHPRASCGKEPIISSASSKLTLEDQDGRKTFQTIRESEVALAVLAETYHVSDAPTGSGS